MALLFVTASGASAQTTSSQVTDKELRLRKAG